MKIYKLYVCYKLCYVPVLEKKHITLLTSLLLLT